jgi:hypothetical protein
MMKKIVMLLAVAAMTCFSTSAFAVHEGEGKASGNLADITIGGSMDIRSRDFRDLDSNKNAQDSQVDTQERVRLDVNVKAGDVKGKVTIENDWDSWGRLETPQANGTTAPSWSTTGSTAEKNNNGRLEFREAWMLFPLPYTPINVKAGHMLLQLGNGWWFRSMKYGSDAWVAFTDIDPVHVGLVDVKAYEGATSRSDDIDAYVLFAAVKLDEKNKIGIDITSVNDRDAVLSSQTFTGSIYGLTNPFKKIQFQNIGLNYTGTLGPVNLQAEVDFQMGKASGKTGVDDSKFKGNQIVIQGKVPIDPVTINFTLARGSGDKYNDDSPNIKQYVPILDNDQHYTFLYEYKVANKGAANLLNGKNGDVHLGFANTTAISAGAMFAATNTLSVGADVWLLQSTEKVAEYGSHAANAATTNELGTEVDVQINWKLADNLTWNWTLGYLAAGKGLGTTDAQGNHKDASTGAQGVLSMKF